MNLEFSKEEKDFLRLAEETVEKWRNILYVDPIWGINVEIFETDDYTDYARINMSNSEYYLATIEISYLILQLEKSEFMKKIDGIISHELLHLTTIDFFMTAQIAAGKRKEISDLLKHKYEQFTSRLHKAFVDLYKKVPERAKEVEK
jgi:hypothetical protein